MNNVGYFIYGLFDVRYKEQIRYIGFTMRPKVRLRDHRNSIVVKQNNYTAKEAWIKSVYDNGSSIDMIILREVKATNWQSWEKCYIQIYKNKGYKLTNHPSMKGGEQYPILFGEENYMFGKTHTDDVKRRLSESSKRFNGKNNPMYGKTHTTEVRKRLSEHFTGICNTTQEQRLEHSKRMTGNGNSFYGKNHSEETKMMLSKALGKAVVKLDLEGNFIARFDSSVQANKSISSGNVKDCINKKLHRAGSFLWMHEIDYKENGITKLEHIIAKNRK